MSNIVKCPSCKSPLEVGSPLLASAICCPVCKTSFSLTNADSTYEAGSPAKQATTPSDFLILRPTGKQNRKSSSKANGRRNPQALLAIVAAAVTTGIIAVLVAFSTRDPVEHATASGRWDVTRLVSTAEKAFASFHWEKYGGTWYINDGFYSTRPSRVTFVDYCQILTRVVRPEGLVESFASADEVDEENVPSERQPKATKSNPSSKLHDLPSRPYRSGKCVVISTTAPIVVNSQKPKVIPAENPPFIDTAVMSELGRESAAGSLDEAQTVVVIRYVKERLGTYVPKSSRPSNSRSEGAGAISTIAYVALIDAQKGVVTGFGYFEGESPPAEKRGFGGLESAAPYGEIARWIENPRPQTRHLP